jgi:hypothetical protein
MSRANRTNHAIASVTDKENQGKGGNYEKVLF